MNLKAQTKETHISKEKETEEFHNQVHLKHLHLKESVCNSFILDLKAVKKIKS